MGNGITRLYTIMEIKLTRGYKSIIDDCDIDLVSGYSWNASDDGAGNVRAMSSTGGRKNRKTIHMARLILNAPNGMYVDHINRNTLDNRRKNLRLCTPGQNMCNRRIQSNNTSGYRGVTWDRQKKKWAARLKHGGKSIHLGRFDDKELAAKAFDEAAKKLRGEFAMTNF